MQTQKFLLDKTQADLWSWYVHTLVGTHSDSLSTGHWADEGWAWQLDFEVYLLSAGPLLWLDHVGERPSQLLRHQEALNIEGELALVGLAWGKLEGNLDAFMSRCAHLKGQNFTETWNKTEWCIISRNSVFYPHYMFICYPTFIMPKNTLYELAKRAHQEGQKNMELPAYTNNSKSRCVHIVR